MIKLMKKGKVKEVVSEMCIYTVSFMSVAVFFAQVFNWMTTM
ncbi:MAG: hypothetical protein Q4D51_00840 [Eubacteriales bacterium]|nr:hypothetical protein [Eubacteriales bacterium]